jgi:hypothetical protein
MANCLTRTKKRKRATEKGIVILDMGRYQQDRPIQNKISALLRTSDSPSSLLHRGFF